MSKTAHLKRYHDWVARQPCIGCGAEGVNVHHVRHDGRKGISKDHTLVAPLCPECHQYGPQAIHTIGHPRFCAEKDVDVYLWATHHYEQFAA